MRIGVVASACRMVLLVVVASSVVSLGSPAQAKLIALEVQITEGDRTVRVSPADFIERINVPGVSGYFGVFEEVPTPRALEQSPLSVRLIVYASRSSPGLVHETFGPDVVRETMVALAYYRIDSDAVAEIKSPGSGSLAPGRWVRISPAFVGIVEEALATAPAVAPVNPPPRRSYGLPSDRDAYLRDLLVPAASVAVAIGLSIVLVALRMSRRAIDREAQRAASVA